MNTEPTTLAHRLAEEIRLNGPLRLDTYMAACLADPMSGYYTNRIPFGKEGDFITAPETSQIFGELIGLWVVATWKYMGEPKPYKLIELGPGRGTLMSDALRAMRVAPDCLNAAEVNLVEMSPTLCELQQQTLADCGAPVSWHTDLAQVEPGPAILIANEFFDALPIRQFVKHQEEWFERLISLDEQDNFIFTRNATPLSHLPFDTPAHTDLSAAPTANDAPVLEICPAAENLITLMAARSVDHPFAGLIIDYGHTKTAFGQTLQAVKAHEFADPLKDQGNVDLTAHVDFETLSNIAGSLNLNAHGPITQSRFLISLGLGKRVERLIVNASEEQARNLTSAAQRLIDPNQMGQLFKVLAITSQSVPAPVPFNLEQ